MAVSAAESLVERQDPQERVKKPERIDICDGGKSGVID
jgi:hypothetical protein